MNEKEIDKIFKEELQNAVEPTFASDWENFEKSLPSRRAGFFGRYFLIGLIGLLALSGVSFWLVSLSGNNDKAQYSIRTTVKKTETEMQKSNLDTTSSITSPEKNENEIVPDTFSNLSEQSKSENENIQNQADESEKSPNDLNAKSAFNKMKSTNAEVDAKNSDQLNAGQKFDQGTQENTGDTNAAKTQPTENSLAEALENNRKDGRVVKSKSTDNLYSHRDESMDSKENDSEIAQNTIEAANNTSKSNPKRENFNAVSDAIYLQAGALVYMNSLSGIIPIPEATDRTILDRDYAGFTKSSIFETLIFFGIEQNAVLRTSPHIGVMEQVHLSKWIVGLGVGLQRSGRLNWNQKANSVTYGFDKYESGIVVNTESVDLLLIPIKLGYHLNGSSRVFAGFTPSILINARQNIQVMVDGTPDPSQSETGYKYQTGAATFHSFLSAGYGYDFSETWNLELGVNYGVKKWKTSSETPVGGFLRVNYIFR